MTKTGPEIRHEAKTRMKKYRAEMTDKGYISTTIFLSQEHRAELKRLGDEHRLTRAEAAEHIFKVYLESDNKTVTQTNNINTNQQAETIVIIEAFEARLKALEEKAKNKAEKIGGQEQNIEPPVDIFETVDNDGAVLELEIELDESEDMGSQTDESEIVIDGLILEPEPEPTEKQISETQAEMFDTIQELVKSKPDQNMELPDYLIGVNPEMTVEERHKIILRLAEDFSDRKNAQIRIDLLNTAGILLGGKPWRTTKQFADQLSIARRWVKKNEKA
jgi:hypothetical protein